jgi:hypothetical protein
MWPFLGGTARLIIAAGLGWLAVVEFGFGTPALFRIVAASSVASSVVDHLPRALRETGVDALVIDGVLIELGLVLMHLEIPYVHVSNSLHYDFSGHTPIFAFDWPHESCGVGSRLNKLVKA